MEFFHGVNQQLKFFTLKILRMQLKTILWQFSVTFNKKLKIVETWMFWQRAQEEKVQSVKEMMEYLTCLTKDITKLKDDLGYYRDEASSSTGQAIGEELKRIRKHQKVHESKANLVALEIVRLEYLLEKAVTCFQSDSSNPPKQMSSTLLVAKENEDLTGMWEEKDLYYEVRRDECDSEDFSSVESKKYCDDDSDIEDDAENYCDNDSDIEDEESSTEP